MNRLQKIALLTIILGISVPTFAGPAVAAATLVDALFGGTKEIVKTMRTLGAPENADIMGKRLENPWEANEAIKDHMATLVAALGLPPNASAESFRSAIEKLPVVDNLHDFQRKKALDFLGIEERPIMAVRFGIDAEHIYKGLSHLTGIVYRSEGFRAVDGNDVYFPYPVRIDVGTYGLGGWKKNKFLTFRRVYTGFAPLVDKVPRGRTELEDFLLREIAGLGFETPTAREMAPISDEKLACWALMILMRYNTGDPMSGVATALFDAMKAGESRSFFGESNANNLYGLAFETGDSDMLHDSLLWADIQQSHRIFRDHIRLWEQNLQKVAVMRREKPEYPFSEIARRARLPLLYAH